MPDERRITVTPASAITSRAYPEGTRTVCPVCAGNAPAAWCDRCGLDLADGLGGPVYVGERERVTRRSLTLVLLEDRGEMALALKWIESKLADATTPAERDALAIAQRALRNCGRRPCTGEGLRALRRAADDDRARA